MEIKFLYLIIKTDKNVREDASKLRGYFANKFKYPIFHNYSKEGLLYSYPRIQYKVLEGTASILGIEEGVKVLKEISEEIDDLKLGMSTYTVKQKVMYEQKCYVGATQKMLNYKFLTPWLALNPNNYQKYREIRDWREKKELLNGILVGNILSMCKGLGIVVEKRLNLHSRLEAEKVEYKVILTGFTGEFRTNFAIPDLLGLGKGVSHGFGIVKNEDRDRWLWRFSKKEGKQAYCRI